MLFCNIDHLEARLLPKTREAGHRFFVGASSLDMLFAHMEAGADPGTDLRGELRQEVQRQASFAALYAGQASANLANAAYLYRDLAAVAGEFTHINDEIKSKAAYDDAARYIGISKDSSVAHDMTETLLRFNVEGALGRIADDISSIADRVRVLALRISESDRLHDRHYDEAHSVLGLWHPLLVSGQFLSAVCYLSARVSA